MRAAADTEHMTGRRFASALVLAVLAAALPALFLISSVGDDVRLVTASSIHLYIVAVPAIVAGLLAALTGRAAAQRRDARAAIASAGFTVLAGILAVHGLASPGVILPADEFHVISASGGLAVPIAGAVLVLAASRRVTVWTARRIWLPLVLSFTTVVGVGTLVLTVPSVVPAIPLGTPSVRGAVVAITLAVYALLIVRTLETATLTRRIMDLGMPVGFAWLATSGVDAVVGSTFSIGFWLSHALELAGTAIVGASLIVDLRRVEPSHALLRRLDIATVVVDEAGLLGGQVRALLESLAHKDEHTREHTERVASLAIQVGRELGLAAAQLRVLAIAALVHDIGKLRTPRGILSKPGSLSDEEFDVIRRHPTDGVAILRHLGGFGSVEQAVLGHHERLDGSGYPRSLAQDDIPLEARILAVCDVYDALTSDRVYRGAWSDAAAQELLVDGAGTTFDPACVAALRHVLERRDGEEPLAA